MALLELKNVSCGYGEMIAVRDLSFAIGAGRILALLGPRAGEVTALLGPNGAGKSSLVLAVGGVLRPRAGSVLLGEKGSLLIPHVAPPRLLPEETFAGFDASRGNSGSYDLQRHLALERRVDGAIGRAHPSMPKLVKASVLAALNLVNSKMSRSRRILQRFRFRIFNTDSSAQQTNHARKPATVRFLERAAAGRTRRNLGGSGLHLLC